MLVATVDAKSESLKELNGSLNPQSKISDFVTIS